MVVVEKSFPRGGIPAPETKPVESKENIIFGATQKKVKKAKPKAAESEADPFLEELQEETIESKSAELLNYNTIQDGMNIMGMVKSVDQLYLTVSLPGRMTARISALEISDSYTKATKEFLRNTENSEVSYKSLPELFHVGQTVYGRVQEIQTRQDRKPYINMSLRPSEVHSELQHINVRKGFMFSGAIEEVQEHGYIIESGIKGMRAFVPLDKSEAGHVTGQLIHLKVEKVSPDKTASTCICKEIQADQMKIKKQTEANIDYILPSTIVHFKVNKQLKDGLQGTIMNEAFTAYVNEHQLQESLALPEDYEVNATLEARVLYVMPLTKLVFLTLNTQHGEEGVLKRGDIVDNAKVHHMGTGGVVLVLNNQFKGLISYKTIKTHYKGNYDQDELLAKYATKSKHKVRILAYDPMSSLYICTDNASQVEEKIFSIEDLKPGDFVTAVVKEPQPKVGGYILQLGKLKGLIEKVYLAPTTGKHLEENAKLKSRVVSVDAARNTVYVTNRPEYMSKQCRVLGSLTDAKVNCVYTGTVVQSGPAYSLVKFFNHVKGVLHHKDTSGQPKQQMSFTVGQTMPFRIVAKKNEQITLGLSEDTFKFGQICPVTVASAMDCGLEVKVTYDTEIDEATGAEQTLEMRGLVPIGLLSDFQDLLLAQRDLHQANSQTEAVCMGKNIFSLRDVDHFKHNLTKSWRHVQEGDVLKAYIKNVHDEIVEIMVPISDYSKYVKIHLKMLLVTAYQSPNIMLNPEQPLYVKVLGKEKRTKTLTVSAKLTDVWNGDLKATADYTETYLNEVGQIRKALKKLSRPIAKFSLGDKVEATFKGVEVQTNNWLYDLADTKLRGIVRSAIVGKSQPPPKVGAKQECVILWIDYSSQTLILSNQPHDLQHITKGQTLAANLVGKVGLNAKVLLKHENVFVCSLKKGQNPLVFCPIRLHVNDFEDSTSCAVQEGDFCKLAFIHDAKPIAVLESTLKLWQDIGRKRKAQEELDELAASAKKAKKSADKEAKHKEKKQLKRKLEEAKVDDEEEDGETEEEEDKEAEQEENLETDEEDDEADEEEDEEADEPTQKKKPKKEANKKKKKEAEEDASDSLFYEDKTPSKAIVARIAKEAKLQASKAADKPAKTLEGATDFWGTDLTNLSGGNGGPADSSDDDDEDDETAAAKQGKKKLTATEKFKQQRDEEARLRAIEEKYADPKQLPESVDQFDRLVLSDPNNSKHWINYMVFHLQSTEIDKARAVAQRAIKSITFREGNEQLNIWIALLNLELRYGTKETFDNTLKEALTYNEPLKVYLRTLEILRDAGNKQQEVCDLIAVITKKFRADPEVWRSAANAYFSIGQTEKAQQLLHKSIASLPEREHVNMIVAFANLNHKHGHNEMAQTLLDQVVTSYPKRVDVWNQYVDLLVKEDLIDSARSVLERAVIQRLPLKKMRTIFKKYLEFEERYGNEANVEKVKQLATEFVKNNSTV